MKVTAPLSKDSSSVRFAPVVQRAPEFAPSGRVHCGKKSSRASSHHAPGAWTLPVVDEEGIFVGFIRKSTVLTVYRQMLADLSND